MARLASSVLFTLIAAAAGHSQDEDRRLSFVNDADLHIWQGGECSAHLSDGPADADIEVKLGGLPPSTAGEEVYMQFWAPRKSPTPYNPLVSPAGCSVHLNLLDAYPRYDAADFNGGNVRVSASGEATIRIRVPSTYFMWLVIAVPHIHLRLCRGANSILRPSDAVMMAGVDMWVASGTARSLTVLSAKAYAGRNAAAVPVVANVPLPVAVITGVQVMDHGSTTLPASTTVSAFPTMQPVQASSASQALISAARDALDLDALEFSPVYLCLLEQKFFNHFSDGCAASCPANAAVAHGQCVRTKTSDPSSAVNTVARSWQLDIECSGSCWHDKKQSTLHNMRLSVASHMDIPFQEVEVSFGFTPLSGRRLAATRTAYMTFTVSTHRVTTSEVSTLLSSFPQDAAAMTSLLGLKVHDVRAHSGVVNSNLNGVIQMNQNNDPYVPAYTAIESPPKGPVASTGTDELTDSLPAGAIIGIAAGVIVLGLVIGLLLVRRQRQRQRQADAQAAKGLEAKVDNVEAAKVGAPAAAAAAADAASEDESAAAADGEPAAATGDASRV